MHPGTGSCGCAPVRNGVRRRLSRFGKEPSTSGIRDTDGPSAYRASRGHGPVAAERKTRSALYLAEPFTPTDLMELITALHSVGVGRRIDGTRANVEQLVELFSWMLNVRINNPIQCRRGVINRKVAADTVSGSAAQLPDLEASDEVGAPHSRALFASLYLGPDGNGQGRTSATRVFLSLVHFQGFNVSIMQQEDDLRALEIIIVQFRQWAGRVFLLIPSISIGFVTSGGRNRSDMAFRRPPSAEYPAVDVAVLFSPWLPNSAPFCFSPSVATEPRASVTAKVGRRHIVGAVVWGLPLFF